MHLTITPLAEQDLEAIGDYIAQDNPRRALSFVEELHRQCERIARNPQGYRRRPELGQGLRSCAHGHYVIFFEANEGEVLIIRVLHGARDLPSLFADEEQR